MGRPVLGSEVVEWKRLRANNMTCAQIARLVGRPKGTVLDHIGHLPRDGRIGPAERERIRRLRGRNKTFPEISAITGRSENACRRYAKHIKRVPLWLATKRCEARRIEALFAACNRAISEARA